MMPDPNILRELTTFEMPFGKYKGCTIARLPVSYLEWFERQGFHLGTGDWRLETGDWRLETGDWGQGLG